MRSIHALIAAVLVAVTAGCQPTGRASLEAPAPSAAPAATASTTAPGPSGQCLAAPVFEAPPVNACTGPARLHLAFVGDVLLHWQLAELGYRTGFHPVWAQPERLLAAADVAVANLEGPVAPGLTASGTRRPDPGPVLGDVYSGYPMFNYHPKVLKDLAASGIDLVTTANNHALDRGPRGVGLTLGEVRKAGLTPVGSIASGAPRRFVTRRATSLGTLAFIACTFGTNGNSDPDRQLLLCYDDRAELLALVRSAATDPAIAGVVVLPHWGVEYHSQPDRKQQALARDLAAAGATLVVGTHPHAVQPWALMPGPAGQVPVVYSTGNFIAVQDAMPSKVEAMALVDLCPGAGGRLAAARAGWVAMQMRLTARGYWVDIAPRGATGDAGTAEAWLRKVAPGFSAQPPACHG